MSTTTTQTSGTVTDIQIPATTVNWFNGLQQEWGKITWPTQLQLLTNVIVVLLMTGLMTLFVWLCDTLFRWGIHLITPDKMGS